MDKITKTFKSAVKFLTSMGTEQKMKIVASLFMLIGGSALAVAAANADEDEFIDISDKADVLDDEAVDTVKVESTEE